MAWLFDKFVDILVQERKKLLKGKKHYNIGSPSLGLYLLLESLLLDPPSEIWYCLAWMPIVCYILHFHISQEIS